MFPRAFFIMTSLLFRCLSLVCPDISKAVTQKRRNLLMVISIWLYALILVMPTVTGWLGIFFENSFWIFLISGMGHLDTMWGWASVITSVRARQGMTGVKRMMRSTPGSCSSVSASSSQWSWSWWATSPSGEHPLCPPPFSNSTRKTFVYPNFPPTLNQFQNTWDKKTNPE